MSRRAPLEALEPVPYLPLVRPLTGAGKLSAREVAGVRIEPVPMLYLPGVPRLNSLALRCAIAPALRRRRETGRIDILDAQFGYPEGAACVRLARELGTASFVTLRGFEVDLLGDDAIRGQLLAAVRGADGCICVSHSLMRVMEAAGADSSRMTVIPNAVERAVFRPGDRAQARSELGLADRGPVVVSVGRLVSGKRHHVLIEAFARLRNRYPSAMLCIIGGPSFEAAVVDPAGRLRPEWARALRERPLRTRRVPAELASQPGWEEAVRRLAAALDPARRPVALAALVLGP